MRDDTKNTVTKTEPDRRTHEALKFYYTPADPARPDRDHNPHAKQTTYVPEVIETLKSRFGDAIREVTLYANEHTVLVEKSRIVDVCRLLKEELGFSYFADAGGIDRFVEEERYEVFYNLVSIENRKRIRLKVRVDEEDMTVPSVTGVYRAANWNEREAWDMFGIKFEGHPDMRRMYMPEDFEYFPLRKEFPQLGIPGSLPLPAQTPGGEIMMDPFPSAHGNKPVKSYEEPQENAEAEALRRESQDGK